MMKLLAIPATAAVLFLAALPARAAVSEAETDQIREALPGNARATPKQPRKVLVFSRAWGYKHSSIPYGAKAFELMAEKTKAFTALITDDDRFFEVDSLQQFHAVLLNNCNNEIFLPENYNDLPAEHQAQARNKDARLRENLRQFIANGNGLMAIHAGIASFRTWPEFGEIMGARFDNHPWNAGSTVTLKVNDPAHPVAHAFCPGPVQITDEIYQFKEERNTLHALISLDTERTNMNKGAALHRSEFPLSWVKTYGQGRVFYCALGHQHDVFWNPTVLQHFLDGLQFALGDLVAKSDRSDRSD